MQVFFLSHIDFYTQYLRYFLLFLVLNFQKNCTFNLMSKIFGTAHFHLFFLLICYKVIIVFWEIFFNKFSIFRTIFYFQNRVLSMQKYGLYITHTTLTPTNYANNSEKSN